MSAMARRRTVSLGGKLPLGKLASACDFSRETSWPDEGGGYAGVYSRSAGADVGHRQRPFDGGSNLHRRSRAGRSRARLYLRALSADSARHTRKLARTVASSN